MKRTIVTEAHIDIALELLKKRVIENMGKHGPGAYISGHEALGVITEEYHEYLAAVASNDIKRVMAEANDLAAAVLFESASKLAALQIVIDEMNEGEE